MRGRAERVNNYMSCPRCGKTVPAGAAFCMHCGTSVAPKPAPVTKTATNILRPSPMPIAPVSAAMAVTPSLAGDFQQQKRRTTMIAILIACIAALFAGGLALKSMGILGQNGRRPGDPSLTAQGKMPDDGSLLATGNRPDGVLMAPGNRQDAPLGANAVAPPEMPDDIYKWLEHLRKTEEKRVDITMGQLTTAYTEKEKSQLAGGVDALKDLLNGIDDPNSELHSPTEKLAGVLKKMHDDTMDLLKFFDSYPPPKECIPIRDAYDQSLNETAGQMGDIADHLASGDVEKLMKMEGKSAQGIDSAGAKTDRLVGEICDKYRKRRWFSIASDIKSSPIFGSGF